MNEQIPPNVFFKRAPNYKDGDFQYYYIFEVFCLMESEKTEVGVSAQALYIELTKRDLKRWGAQNLKEQQENLNVIKATLRDNRTGQILSGRARTLGLFRTIGRNLWTLPEFDECSVLVEDLTQRNTEGSLRAAKALQTYLKLKASSCPERYEYVGTVEGNLVPAGHLRRERGPAAKEFKKRLESLKCEVCDFDFGETYGIFAADYIEAHHVVPLHKGARITHIEDFKAVCSNCHRMLHWKGERSVEDLRATLAK